MSLKTPRLYYHEEHEVLTRLKQSMQICEKYPTRVPVIVQPKPKSLAPWLRTCKFLVPKTSTIAALLHHVRSKLTLNETIGLYYLVGTNTQAQQKEVSYEERYEVVNGCDLIGNLYKQYLKEDGFCYIYYDEESMFGSLILR